MTVNLESEGVESVSKIPGSSIDGKSNLETTFKPSVFQEIVPTHEYLHRHERGAFWMARPEGDIAFPLGQLLCRGRVNGYLLDVLTRPEGWPMRYRDCLCVDARLKTDYLFKKLRGAP